MKAARIVSLVALALALGAGIYLALAPCTVRSVTAELPASGVPESPVAPKVTCQSLLDAQGNLVLVALGIPVMLTLVGVAAAWKGWKGLISTAAVLLLAFSVVTGFSIGLVFIPSAIALVASAVIVIAA